MKQSWGARHHLASDELRELAALQDTAGGGGGPDHDFEADEGAGSDLDLDLDDLGEISVDADGEITVAARPNPAADQTSGAGEREASEPPLPAGPLRVALMGAPNAGKSTLLNSLLGWERALTGERPRIGWVLVLHERSHWFFCAALSRLCQIMPSAAVCN